ncbi:MAG: sigma-70 family RNA polymerase sigma factor [Thermoanaerobaculia bacterium]
MTTTDSNPTNPAVLTSAPPPPDPEICSRRHESGRLTDAELLAGAAAGSESAFSRLHQRLGRPLFSTAVRMLHDAEDAAEVLQETFLYAWSRADSYDPSRAAVSTWLALILRSRCIDRLRRREYQRKMRSSIEQEKPENQCDPAGFDRLLNQQRRRCLNQAMEQLPAAQKQVLELAYYRGLTQREIADKVGVPLGTIKTRSVLAMNKLHQGLTGRPRTPAATG